MLIDIEIKPDTFKEISKLVKEGRYEDAQQFMLLAIENLIKREKQAMGKSAQYSENKARSVIERITEDDDIDQVPDLEYFAGSKPLTTYYRDAYDSIGDFLRGRSVEESSTWKASPLIWKFYSRFFPVKLVVLQVATEMMNRKSNWVTLENLQDNSYALALAFAALLREHELKNQIPRNKKLSTGLPATESIKEGKKGRAVTKAITKIESSRKRFSNQLIGSWVNKRSQTGKTRMEFEAGACCEMGLIGYEFDESGDMFLTLTKEGKEFASMKNPIINDVNFKKVFSIEESEFILKKIIPRFKLEAEIVNYILIELKTKKTLTAAEIDNIFESRKLEFISAHPKEAETNDIQTFKDLKTVKSCPKCGKKSVVSDIKSGIWCEVDSCGFTKPSPNIADRIATMGRLAELGVVIWSLDSQAKSVYTLGDTKILA